MGDVLTKERTGKLTKDSWPKPREWSHFQTENAGEYLVLLQDPKGEQYVMSEVTVEIAKGQVASLSIRTSIGLSHEVSCDG